MGKNVIAVFDFDGTITTKDTLFDFVAFYHGKVKLFLGLICISPILVLFKLKMISNESAKRRMFSFFFKNENIEKFEAKCVDYQNRIDEITKVEATSKIRWHQEQEHKVIIISASVDKWIEPWAMSIGIKEVVGTQVEVLDGRITGQFISKNCHGQEKVNRLLAAYPRREEYELYMYGDSSGDREMLVIADYPFYRKF